VDLEEFIIDKQKNFSLNEVKEMISRGYSIFSETEIVYKESKTSFLYRQNRKIMNCFGMIFLSLIEKVEKRKGREDTMKSRGNRRGYEESTRDLKT
jgi:hypothetical protein